jgi:hypothetical protein
LDLAIFKTDAGANQPAEGSKRMIHIIYDTKSGRLAKFSTNVSGLQYKVPVSWESYDNEDSNVLYTLDGSGITMAEFFQLVAGDEPWDGSPVDFGMARKQVYLAGDYLVVTREGEELDRWRIRPHDEFLEVDVTAYQTITNIPGSAVLELTGFYKSHGRFRLYYQGPKELEKYYEEV